MYYINIFITLYIYFIAISVIQSNEPPKLMQWPQPNGQFKEGVQFKAICSISSGSKPFFYSWTKNGQQIPSQDENISIMTIDTSDMSVLSISNVKTSDAGNYTCTVRNEFGTDYYAITLIVDVPPKWVIEPRNVSIILGEDLEVMCDAEGFPMPKIYWKRSFPIINGDFIDGKTLKIKKVQLNDTGIYKCMVSNGNEFEEPVLEKTIMVKVMVPAKFDEKFSVVQVKRSESTKLKCNASGDQPLTITWTRDNVKLDKLGGHNYEIFETITDGGMNSELFLRSTQRTDGTIYKCDAENEHGKDDRTIKLVIVEVPGPPMNVHIKEVWSRSASVVWSPPYSGNSPISKYTIQYWRHQSAPHRLHEFSVSSSQTSALIKDLNPGLSYELTIVGENDVGRGEAADTVTFITGEEEPSAPPNDITVEARGPTTIRVTWKSPPTEHWNGVLKGYYVGYKKTREPNHPYTLKLIEPKPLQKSKTPEIETYEYFLREIMKGTEYSIIVKAFNSAGSGPQSHEMQVKTFDGDLPPQQQLIAFDATRNTLSLRWHKKDLKESQSPPVTSYTIHYQREGEPKWREIPVPVTSGSSPMTDDTSMHSILSHNYVLQSLEQGTQYRIYITATNKYGLSDPSNIVVFKTEGDRPLISSEVLGPYYDGNPYYLQPTFTIPVLSAIVIIVIVFIVAFVCVKKIRSRTAHDNLMLDSATIGKQYLTGTSPRYMDFEKVQGKPLMLTEAGNIYPTPYATMPMGERSDECGKPWDRPLPVPSMKKDHHIYDHPQ